VQDAQRLKQSLADVRVDRGGSLAPGDYPRLMEVNGNDFGEGAAEVDEETKGRHQKQAGKVKIRAANISELRSRQKINGEIGPGGC
jgi:hypothetical protein